MINKEYVCPNCMKVHDRVYETCPDCGFRRGTRVGSRRVLRPGTAVNGKYMLGVTLGEGGFGITYLAYDLNMETTVAIKALAITVNS